MGSYRKWFRFGIHPLQDPWCEARDNVIIASCIEVSDHNTLLFFILDKSRIRHCTPSSPESLKNFVILCSWYTPHLFACMCMCVWFGISTFIEQWIFAEQFKLPLHSKKSFLKIILFLYCYGFSHTHIKHTLYVCVHSVYRHATWLNRSYKRPSPVYHTPLLPLNSYSSPPILPSFHLSNLPWRMLFHTWSDHNVLTVTAWPAAHKHHSNNAWMYISTMDENPKDVNL